MAFEEKPTDDASDETIMIPRGSDQSSTNSPVDQPGPDGEGLSDEDAESMLAVQTLERHRKERKRRRIIRTCVIAGIVLVIICAFVLPGLFSGGADSGAAIATTSAYRGTLTDSVTASGAAQPVTSVWAVAEVEGTVGTVNVTEGQQVNEGDVLFTINSDDVQQTLQSAQTSVDNAQSALDTAKSRLANARNMPTTTDEEGNVIENDLSSYEDAVTEAEASLASAQDELSKAQSLADKCQVRAPQAGTVVSCTAESGQSTLGTADSSATSTGAQVQIADLSQMQVTVQVSEDDITRIVADQKATVTFSALPDVTLDATVTHIAITPSSSGSSDYSDGGASVTYDVDLLIPSPDPHLKPGMTADVEIVLDSVDDAIIVPSTAVWEGDDGTYVTVVTLDDEGNIETSEDVKVEVRLSTDSESAVAGAISDGDLVLLGGGSSDASGADASAEEEAAAEGSDSAVTVTIEDK